MSNGLSWGARVNLVFEVVTGGLVELWSHKLRSALTLTLLMTCAASIGAQSLADVARREEARRKQIAKPSRVLTNKENEKAGIKVP